MTEPQGPPVRHLEISIRNRETYEFLHAKTPRHIGWEIPIIFYGVMHLADYYLVQRGRPQPLYHGERKDAVRAHIEEITDDYMSLHDLGVTARYVLGHAMCAKDLEVTRRLAGSITKTLLRLLSERGIPAPPDDAWWQ